MFDSANLQGGNVSSTYSSTTSQLKSGWVSIKVGVDISKTNRQVGTNQMMQCLKYKAKSQMKSIKPNICNYRIFWWIRSIRKTQIGSNHSSSGGEKKNKSTFPSAHPETILKSACAAIMKPSLIIWGSPTPNLSRTTITLCRTLLWSLKYKIKFIHVKWD